MVVHEAELFSSALHGLGAKTEWEIGYRAKLIVPNSQTHV